jgi:hypothetical protein
MITDEEMLRVYGELQTIRRKAVDTLAQGRIVRESDYELPNSYPLSCLVFGQMASDFTRGLIGEVNRFFLDVHHADCWIRVVADYEENKKYALLWEFAEPLLELSVGRPYSIRSHFSFAVVHLLNQWSSHKIPNWKDELPCDRLIDYNWLKTNKDKFSAAQNQFKDFLDKLDQLNDKTFIDKTQNFRNLLQHRFRLQFDMGLTPFFERNQTKTGVTYAYKIFPPLQLETLIPDLYTQHQKAVETFKAYWQLLHQLCNELGAVYSVQPLQ